MAVYSEALGAGAQPAAREIKRQRHLLSDRCPPRRLTQRLLWEKHTKLPFGQVAFLDRLVAESTHRRMAIALPHGSPAAALAAARRSEAALEGSQPAPPPPPLASGGLHWCRCGARHDAESAVRNAGFATTDEMKRCVARMAGAKMNPRCTVPISYRRKLMCTCAIGYVLSQ
jgi:hypothetical protein